MSVWRKRFWPTRCLVIRRASVVVLVATVELQVRIRAIPLHRRRAIWKPDLPRPAVSCGSNDRLRLVAGGEHHDALRAAFSHVLPAVGTTGFFDEGAFEGIHETGSGHAQSSKTKPGTRRNSRVLWVIKMASKARACAAMSRSSGPMVFPDFSNAARMRP